MRTRGRKSSIGITMSPELIEKLDSVEVGGTRNLPRSTKISMIVERYIREYEAGVRDARRDKKRINSNEKTY